MRRDVRLFIASLVAAAWVGSGWPPFASSQMGPMGGQAPGPPDQMAEPTEHGRKTLGGLEITLLTAPPLSPDQMAKMMPGMGEMKGMGPMGGMQQMPSPGSMKKRMGPMQGMGGMEGQPTHWIGVLVRDLKDDRVMPGLEITLTAQKGGWARNVTLMPMPGSYGANIALPSRGGYEVHVRISLTGRPPVEAAFDLDYR